MHLPPSPRIAALLEGVSRKDLGRRVERLSAAYRAGQSSIHVASRDDALAYLVARAPATYAAVAAALARALDAVPDFKPQSLLDIGAGPGTASWAVRDIWPDIGVTMLDNNPVFRALADELIDTAQIVGGDLASVKSGADLVIASYVLAELPEHGAAAAARGFWDWTGAMLVLVEPGTPQGFARIRKARAALIEAGAHIAAPCTHNNVCPMAGKDWCHFSVRLARSRDHMIAKGASVPFEDERYAYVVVVRDTVRREHPARIIKPVVESKPGLTLPLCDANGLRDDFIARRDKEVFRRARKLDWGDEWPA